MDDRIHQSNGESPVNTPADGTYRIRIPKHVGLTVARRLPETAFDSVDEYVTFVIESVLRQIDEQEDTAEITVRDGHGSRADADETAVLQERLESLGYL